MQTAGPHIFFDFDSTIVTKESFDEVIAYALADHPDQATLTTQVEAITTRGMEGELAFTASLKERFRVAPLTRHHFEHIGAELLHAITPGMTELFGELQHHNISTYIISGGFRDSILPVAKTLGAPDTHIYTNAVRYDKHENAVAIDETNVCFTNEGKAPVITAIAAAHTLTKPFVMIGDGANDLRAYELGVADHFCAFTGNVARVIMQERAPHTANTTAELRDFIFSLAAV